MSMDFMDSCDHYDQDLTIALKWTVNNGGVSIAGGRNNRGIQLGGGFIGKTLTYQSGWVCGWAVKFNTESGFSRGPLYDAMHAGEAAIVSLYTEGDGTLSIYTNGGNLLMDNSGPAGLSFHPNTWYYIEFKYSIGGSPISVTAEVKVNGQVWATKANFNSTINVNSLLLQEAKSNFHRYWAGGIVNGTTSLDDFGIASQNGSGVVDYFGDLKLGCVYPAIDKTIQWTPLNPGPSFSELNEQYPDDDASYVYSSAASNVDSFIFQAIAPFMGQVIAVHYGIYARKDDEGTRSLQPVFGSGATKIGTVFFPGDTYVYYFICMDQVPGGGPWDVATFNSSIFGFEQIT